MNCNERDALVEKAKRQGIPDIRSDAPPHSPVVERPGATTRHK